MSSFEGPEEDVRLDWQPPRDEGADSQMETLQMLHCTSFYGIYDIPQTIGAHRLSEALPLRSHFRRPALQTAQCECGGLHGGFD